MQKFRVDFSKGINVVGNKAIINEGSVTIADNADLRSGAVKPIKACTSTNFGVTPATTAVQIFEHRGKKRITTTRYDYVGLTSAGADVIYAATPNAKPVKFIGNSSTSFTLGITPPAAAPIVTSSTALSPVLSLEETPSSGFGYRAGTILSYRISVETEDGVQPPGFPARITVDTLYSDLNITADSSSIKLSWASVQGAKAYHIFKGVNGADLTECKVITDGNTSWIDSGQDSGSGTPDYFYDNKSPYQYFYTFQRRTGPIVDESGISPISAPVSSTYGRRIKFDIASDGYFDQDGAVTVASASLVKTATMSPPTTLGTMSESGYYGRKKITQAGGHGLSNGDKIRITSTDENWGGYEFDVYVDISDTNVFYIESNAALITDGAATYSKCIIGLVFNAPSEGMPAVGSTIKVSATGMLFAAKVLSVDLSSPASIVVSQYVADDATVSIKYIPNNSIIYRRLYRNSSIEGFFLVDSIPAEQTEYEDGKSNDRLGEVCPSYYVESGLTIITAPPPKGLHSIEEHYGMLFGIDGSRVRWTQIGRHDSWPDVFYFEFGFRPVKLKSFAQGLIVICPDAIYRIDGNNPTQLQLTKTHAEDGCLAPNTVIATTDYGLLYVGRRGVMSFNGTEAKCVTDAKVPSDLFWGTSVYQYDSDSYIKPQFPWIQTLASYNYANLAYNDGILASVPDWVSFAKTSAGAAINHDMKAFYLDGKYFVYWGATPGGLEDGTNDGGSSGKYLSSNSYQGNTAICIDMVAGGAITTLGLKAIDVFVNEEERVYALLNGVYPTVEDENIAFFDKEMSLSSDTSNTVVATPRVVELFSSRTDVVPYHIRTGAIACDAPMIRKVFQSVEFHTPSGIGGTARVRVYIDGRYICDGRVVASANPSRHNKVNIPIGKQIGYNIDIELVSDTELTGLAVVYDQYEG